MQGGVILNPKMKVPLVSICIFVCGGLLLSSASVMPQESPVPKDEQIDTGGHGMTDMMQAMHPKTFSQAILGHAGSGTSAEPNSTPVPMLMWMKANWMLMF